MFISRKEKEEDAQLMVIIGRDSKLEKTIRSTLISSGISVSSPTV